MDARPAFAAGASLPQAHGATQAGRSSRDYAPLLPAEDGRTAYETSTAELRDLSRSFALEFLDTTYSADQLGRDLGWTAAVFRLPDDGTGALPLIRHILINDNTSATYKPALLRSILRVAENAKGAVLHEARGYVDIPLGLVALYWLRMFRGLILDRGYAQMPKGNGSPKFDNEHFRFLGMEGATTMLVHVEHGMPTPPSVLLNSPGGVLHLNQAFRIEVSVHSCRIGPLLPAQ